MSRSACEVCGETYDYCGQCGTCHKCMGEDIDRLKAELETTQLHLMEEETTRKIWEQDCKKAESQLAEARAEAAREILHSIYMETIDRIYEKSQAGEIIRQRFGLEG